MRRLFAIGALILAGACTPSESVCNTAEALKLSFDEFAIEGEFSQRTVLLVNAAYDEGIKVCTAPVGTYDQAAVIASATKVILVIRKAMRESDVAYQAMGPQIRKLEALLKEARK